MRGPDPYVVFDGPGIEPLFTIMPRILVVATFKRLNGGSPSHYRQQFDGLAAVGAVEATRGGVSNLVAQP